MVVMTWDLFVGMQVGVLIGVMVTRLYIRYIEGR